MGREALDGLSRRCVERVVDDYEESKGLRLILHVCNVHKKWREVAIEVSRQGWAAWAADGWLKVKVLKEVKQRLGYLNSFVDAIRVETIRLSKEVKLSHDISCSCQGP